MIFVEPEASYLARVVRASPPTFIPQPVAPVPVTEEAQDTFWERILFETLRLEGGLPVKIISLVSSTAKWGDYGRRADRENRKLELLRLVGRLIQQGKLRRHARNFVFAPPDPPH